MQLVITTFWKKESLSLTTEKINKIIKQALTFLL